MTNSKKIVVAKTVPIPIVTPVTLLSLLITAGAVPAGSLNYKVKGFTLMHKTGGASNAEIKVGPATIDDTAGTPGILPGVSLVGGGDDPSAKEYDMADFYVVATVIGRSLFCWLTD